MIFWNDFDHRATKVFCDKCESNITAAVENALKGKPNIEKLKIAGGSNLETLTRQHMFYYNGRKFVVMEFHVGDRQKPYPNEMDFSLLKALRKVYSILRS